MGPCRERHSRTSRHEVHRQSMKPTELPPHLWPACRRVMLRHAASLARDMLDYAEDSRLRVNRATLESIEHRALGELAAGADTIEKAAADLRLMPPAIVASSQERSKFSVQLRTPSRLWKVLGARRACRRAHGGSAAHAPSVRLRAAGSIVTDRAPPTEARHQLSGCGRDFNRWHRRFQGVCAIVITLRARWLRDGR